MSDAQPIPESKRGRCALYVTAREYDREISCIYGLRCRTCVHLLPEVVLEEEDKPLSYRKQAKRQRDRVRAQRRKERLEKYGREEPRPGAKPRVDGFSIKGAHRNVRRAYNRLYRMLRCHPEFGALKSSDDEYFDLVRWCFDHRTALQNLGDQKWEQPKEIKGQRRNGEAVTVDLSRCDMDWKRDDWGTAMDKRTQQVEVVQKVKRNAKQ